MYIQVLGSIIYATQTHSDIQHAIGVLSQFGANPGKVHLEALKYVLRYLNGTAYFALILGWKGTDGINLIGWTNLDWAQDTDMQKSISGFVFNVAGSKVD